MDELDIYEKLSEISTPQFSLTFGDESERAIKIAEHKTWLQSIRHERPNTSVPYKVGIYIRFFNQTKYDNYLAYHKKEFLDTIGLCPNWELVDFYIDEGQSAPNMETAKEWSRLLCDAMDGKVNLIITQKISNVSKKIHEVTFCSRILAGQKPPIGIYFISEDIFTLASYYQNDLHDTQFLPSGMELLPDSDDEPEDGMRRLPND